MEEGHQSICMYTPAADGGHPRYAQELLNALSEHPRGSNYQFELVSSEDLRPQFRSEHYVTRAILPPLVDRNSFSSRASWVFNRLTHYPRRELNFLRWLRTRPEVVGIHFQEWVPWLAAPMFRRIRRMGKKIFYTVHNVVPHKYPRFVPKSIMDGWVRRGCLLCDCLYVHTDRLADELSRFLGAPHPPIQVVPHGVWTVNDFSSPLPIDERLAWKKLLFFGAIRRNKGLDLLLRAAELLDGYSITIAGEPGDMEYYRGEVLPLIARLKEKGVHVNLIDRFIPDDQVGPLFSSHSVIVLPYTRGFVAQSGVAFMALAYELPVVASEAGGLHDLMNEFSIGQTFRDSTPEALANAVKALYAQDNSQRLSEEISAAKRRYSWHAAAGATLAGYALNPEVRTVRQENDCAVETTPAH